MCRMECWSTTSWSVRHVIVTRWPDKRGRVPFAMMPEAPPRNPAPSLKLTSRPEISEMHEGTRLHERSLLMRWKWMELASMHVPRHPMQASRKYVLLRQMGSFVARSMYTPWRLMKRAWLYQIHQSCPLLPIQLGVVVCVPPTASSSASRGRRQFVFAVLPMWVNGATQLPLSCC